MAIKIRTTSSAGTDESGLGAIERMNRDWEALTGDVHAEDEVASWSRQDSEFAGVNTPQRVVELLGRLGRRGDWEQHDLTMAALIRRIGGDAFGSQVAWRIAARVFLPKTILMTKGQLRPNSDWDFVFSTMLSALFEVLCTYRLDRRPRGVFPNIAVDTLSLARTTLAADQEDRVEMLKLGRALEPLVGDPNVLWVTHHSQDPQAVAELAELLARVSELEIVRRDEPELAEGEARAELLDLVMWAVDASALKASDARRITDYYLSTAMPGRAYRTTRAMGADGDRLRQRASRAVRPLRRADLGAYRTAA